MSSTDQTHTSHRIPRGRASLRWTALVAAAATGVVVVTQLSGGVPGSVGSAAPVTCTDRPTSSTSWWPPRYGGPSPRWWRA